MPVYYYICNDCAASYTEEDINQLDNDSLGEAVLFQTIHTMAATDEEKAETVICPRCDSNNCKQWYHGTNITGYVSGIGWKDYAGLKRDMNVYHLDNQDPYSKHRVPGEVDHVRSELKKTGKHNPNTKVFAPRISPDST